jgi:hypothetical protein
MASPLQGSSSAPLPIVAAEVRTMISKTLPALLASGALALGCMHDTEQEPRMQPASRYTGEERPMPVSEEPEAESRAQPVSGRMGFHPSITDTNDGADDGRGTPTRMGQRPPTPPQTNSAKPGARGQAP